MKGNSYSQAYLSAISDERRLLRDMQARGEYVPSTDAPAFLKNCESTLARGYCGAMAESLKGARDFWRGQCAKLERAGQ